MKPHTNNFCRNYFYFFTFCLIPFYLQAMEEKNFIVVEKSAPQEKFPDIMDELVYDILITRQEGNSPTLNYFINAPRFYPDEQTVEKIETEFITHLSKKNKTLDAKFDAQRLVRFMQQALHFARFTKPESPKYKLHRLFTDLRQLDACIPQPSEPQKKIDCCTKTIHNTDSLDKQKIEDSIKQFYSNTIPLWKSLNKITQESVPFVEFAALRHRMLDYYHKRLSSYIEDPYTTNSLYKKFIPAAITFPPGVALAGIGLSLGNPIAGGLGLLCCGFGICSLALLQPDSEQECKHHNQDKVKALIHFIENHKNNFKSMAQNFNK